MLFHNFGIVMKTCNMDYILFGVPIWKHVYHTLHSMDKWFINPNMYEEPPFHTKGLNSIDEISDNQLSEMQLNDYFEKISEKVGKNIQTLDDATLMEKPDGCERTRLDYILGQIRHTCCHLGNINAATMIEKSKWPKVVGIGGRLNDELYE